MPIQSLSNRTLANNGLARWAYDMMLERIVRGDYAIGQVISRRRIAADLGVSFLPASEALLRLECEGLLESRPRAGTRIRIPTRQDVDGHFMVREALEVHAAMIFAERSTKEERAELIRLASQLDARTRTQTPDTLSSYLDLHEKLHLKLAEYTHCDALNEAIRKQSALTSAWLGAMKTTMPRESPPGHERVMKTLARQKPAAAGEAMRVHVHADRECTLLSLKPYFDVNRKYIRTYSRTIRRTAGGNAAHSPAA